MRALQMSFLRNEFINLSDCRDELSPKEIRDLYRKAIAIAADFQQKEIELIDVLKDLDSTKVYRISGMNSLFSFATQILKLSEHQAFTYITLARKCIEVPEVQNALAAKEISVSKARRLCAVINKSNQNEWITLAKKSTSKELDKAIRQKDPKALVYDSVRYLTENLLTLSATIDEETSLNLNRVKQLMMSHRSERVDYNEMLKELTELYLDRHDPVREAERAHAKAKVKIEKDILLKAEASYFSGEHPQHQLVDRRVDAVNATHKRGAIKAELKHFVFKRDLGQCRFHAGAKRCSSRIHLEIHHRVPVSEGGSDTAENLVLLCSAHHRWLHQSH